MTTNTSNRGVPKMGTAAIFTKRNDSTTKPQKEDSEIIAEIVTEKFLGSNAVTENQNENRSPEICHDIPEIIVSSAEESCTKCEDDNDEFQYDAKEFLKDALGDELCNCSLSECSENKNVTLSSANSTSIGTSRISSLMNSLYNSFTKHLDKGPSTYTSSPFSDKIEIEEDSTDFCSLDTTAGVLIQEVAVQHQIIVETSKALNICLNSKEFILGPERREAEKILLLAVYKREIILKELSKLQYESIENLSCVTYGKITISNITFPPSHAFPPQENPNKWFMVIISCGTNVTATDIVTPDNYEEIKFPNTFEFDNLSPNFEIVIGLYALFTKNNSKPSCNQEITFLNKKNTVKCPIPHRFFHKCCKKNLRTYYSYERRDPCFKPWGVTVLRKTDLNQTSSGFLLDQVPKNVNLRGVLLADISSNVRFTKTHSGFLTIKSESDKFATWNRYWCSLNGYILNYWNYPTDQDTQIPIGTIDLRYCVNSSLSCVDRDLCPRPRTLLLETDEDLSVSKHYLSADSLQDMNAWQKHLNSILSSLKSWNMMKCDVHF